MLQIITGKFFTSEELYITRQRGVLFANYYLNPFEKIETISGTLLPADSWNDVATLVYEVDQRLEAINKDGTKSFLIATHFDPLIQDFAAVASFALDITCTPDVELARRLTQSTKPQLGIEKIPKAYLKRVFDSRINYKKEDDENLQQFVKNIVGLERKNYEAVIRAIRRYVTGLHRISDDIDLAYTLLVASIESLVQKFDGFIPVWEDYTQDKRQAIDEALKKASVNTKERVQKAILNQEHIALSKRFKEFTLSHINPSFFREETANINFPVSRNNLVIALDEAYKFRSKYVHTLQELPRIIKNIDSSNDTFNLLGTPVFTLHGLARVAKHVINEFITRSMKIEREDYDYRSNLPNIVSGLRLAERYWIWNSQGYSYKTAKNYLNGFLSELTNVLKKEEDAQLTDITEVLKAIEKQIKGLKNYKQRLPMLTLYLLFHVYLNKENHRPNWENFINSYADDFNHNTIESLLVSVLVKDFIIFETEDFEETRRIYFSQRAKKNALNFGSTFEALIALNLAEHHRQNGNDIRAFELISEAVETLPGHISLLNFEGQAKESITEINSWTILFSKNTSAEKPEITDDIKS